MYTVDEQCLYLVAKASELYQCGTVGLQDRHGMITDALGTYSQATEHDITHEAHYCADCCCNVPDVGVVVGSVDDEGIYHGPAPAQQRLGYLDRDPLDEMTYLYQGQALEHASVVCGLLTELNAGITLQLTEQVPDDFRSWRWA